MISRYLDRIRVYLSLFSRMYIDEYAFYFMEDYCICVDMDLMFLFGGILSGNVLTAGKTSNFLQHGEIDKG